MRGLKLVLFILYFKKAGPTILVGPAFLVSYSSYLHNL